MFRFSRCRPSYPLWMSLLFCGLLSCGSGLAAAPADEASTPQALEQAVASTNAAIENAKQQISDLQKQQDSIKQQITPDIDAEQLSSLNIKALSLVDQAYALMDQLQPLQQQAQTGLNLMGPAPTAGASPESPDIVARRAQLQKENHDLNNLVKEINRLSETSAQLSRNLLDLRSKIIKALAFKRTHSILSPGFWTPPDQIDQGHLQGFFSAFKQTFAAAWGPSLHWASTGLLIGAVLLWVLGRMACDQLIVWACRRWLPEGHIRRSIFACTQVLASLSLAVIAVDWLETIFLRPHGTDVRVQAFVNNFGSNIIECILISELGRSLLSVAHPDWRLAPISNKLAHALRSTPWVVAGVMILFQALETLNQAVGTHLEVTLFGYGLNALALTLTFSWLLLKIRRARRLLGSDKDTKASADPEVDEKQPDPQSTMRMSALAQVLVYLVVIGAGLALVVGYISMARLFTYQLVWAFIVLTSAYLVLKLLISVCNGLLSRSYRPGQTIQQTLGLEDRHMDQASTILSGATRVTLVCLVLLALITSSFGTSTGELLQNLFNDLSGGLLQRLNISLTTDKIFNAILSFSIGLYLVRVLYRWLNDQLLPKTGMDPGMHVSLVTLVSNIGYVLVVLVTMTALGIQLDKLAWIVSALSVGIGFGLQEIVKNFISGLILLTERPVKVGDMVVIGGTSGDVRRIKVRATEIQLSDRSTMIVPNSQLISSSLINKTMNHAQGVVSLAFKFQDNIDAKYTSELLLQTLKDNKSILKYPEPSVSFSEFAPNVIELSAVGYVSSPRLIDGTKSTLRFDILKRLRETSIFPLKQAHSVVSIALTLPLDTDPNKARELLLKAYANHPDILQDPAPAVSFTHLDASGIALSISGHISDPYRAGGIKSDLLFTILNDLRQAGIPLSSPQNIMLQTAKPDSAAATRQELPQSGPPSHTEPS